MDYSASEEILMSFDGLHNTNKKLQADHTGLYAIYNYYTAITMDYSDYNGWGRNITNINGV